MADDKRSVRVPLLLTEEEAKELDDWQFTNRLRTRSHAIRQIMFQAGVLSEAPGEVGKRGRPVAAVSKPPATPVKPKRGGKP